MSKDENHRTWLVRVDMNLDVVICAKNEAESLEQVLEQVIREVPFSNLIVIYGSSRDRTKVIAEKYTKNVFWDGDKGLGAARALGIKKAKSEIVAMIDADVILTEGWYHQLIGHFENPEVAAVMGTCIYGYGCKPLESYYEYLRWKEPDNWGCHNTMFRCDAILKVGNFDETIQGAQEDHDMYLRLLNAGYKWIWVRNVTVYHPMTLREHLDHVYWWCLGKLYVKIMYQKANKSSFRLYGRFAFSVLQSFFTGVRLSINIHPIFLLYYPLVKMTCYMARVRALKNLLMYTINQKNGTV
jgi:glycosyltransferase involved in cell wall biosynthesis